MVKKFKVLNLLFDHPRIIFLIKKTLWLKVETVLRYFEYSKLNKPKHFNSSFRSTHLFKKIYTFILLIFSQFSEKLSETKNEVRSLSGIWYVLNVLENLKKNHSKSKVGNIFVEKENWNIKWVWLYGLNEGKSIAYAMLVHFDQP